MLLALGVMNLVMTPSQVMFLETGCWASRPPLFSPNGVVRCTTANYVANGRKAHDFMPRMTQSVRGRGDMDSA